MYIFFGGSLERSEAETQIRSDIDAYVRIIKVSDKTAFRRTSANDRAFSTNSRETGLRWISTCFAESSRNSGTDVDQCRLIRRRERPSEELRFPVSKCIRETFWHNHPSWTIPSQKSFSSVSVTFLFLPISFFFFCRKCFRARLSFPFLYLSLSVAASPSLSARLFRPSRIPSSSSRVSVFLTSWSTAPPPPSAPPARSASPSRFLRPRYVEWDEQGRRDEEVGWFPWRPTSLHWHVPVEPPPSIAPRSRSPREPTRDDTAVTGETEPYARNPALLNFIGRRHRREDGVCLFSSGSYSLLLPPSSLSPSLQGGALSWSGIG